MTEQTSYSRDEALDLLDRLPRNIFTDLNRWPDIPPQPRAAWRAMLADGTVDPTWFIKAVRLIGDIFDIEPAPRSPHLRIIRGGGA